VQLRFHRARVAEVLNGVKVQAELERHAAAVVSRAQGKRGTSRLTFRTTSGKSRRGAFAQARMSGPGALAVEFGTRNNPPYAPLRSSLPR
jgi:hypothetical protein